MACLNSAVQREYEQLMSDFKHKKSMYSEFCSSTKTEVAINGLRTQEKVLKGSNIEILVFFSYSTSNTRYA